MNDVMRKYIAVVEAATASGFRFTDPNDPSLTTEKKTAEVVACVDFILEMKRPPGIVPQHTFDVVQAAAREVRAFLEKAGMTPKKE